MGKYSDGDMINRFLMTKLKKRIIYWLSMATFLSCIYVLMGCSKGTSKGNSEDNGTTFHFTHEPSNAIYHWKTTFCPNTYERDFIKSHQIKRMYLKFFDVGVDNMFDGEGEQAIPIATTIFKDSIKNVAGSDLDVVPVVFITVDALRIGKSLCEKILRRVDDMCRAQHIEYHEVQLDCDWTKDTKEQFYSLCQEARRQLRQGRKGLSATIRLHQLRDSLPDVDYGVLMLYNTESLHDPKVLNSILSSKVVSEYMRHAHSDKHLDFAYPTYEWTLWFKENRFMGILAQEDSVVERDGVLRHERSDYKEIMETKSVLKKNLMNIGYPSSNIIYHLDSANLSKYSNHEIEKIYSL